MITLTTKIMIWAGVVLTLGLLSVIVFQQFELKKQQTAFQTQITAQQTLIDGVVRASSTWATKDDVASLLNASGVNSQALAAIQSDMAVVKATLSAANVITVNSTGQVSSNLPSSSTGTATPSPAPVTVACPSGGTVSCPSTDPFGYDTTPQNFTLDEEFGTLKVPFGTVTFDASKQTPWSENIPQRTYQVSNVIGIDQNQKITVYNKFDVKVNGQTYTAPISTAITETIYPTAKWSWFNPRLYLGVDGAVDITHVQGAVVPNVNVQFMSYGKYLNQPDFSILQLGAGYNTVTKVPELTVTPFSFNVGQYLPLMNNLYVGPSLSVGTDGNFLLGAGVRVGL